MGLDQVRELSGRTIERIIARRPYAGLEDFLARADPRPQEALNLARVGALEGFGTIPALLQRLERGGWQPGQPGLFAWGEPGPLPDWTLAEKGAAQTELLGVSLDAHPLELLAGRIAAAGAVSTVEAAGRIGQRLTVAGVRQSGHRSRTAKGETMMFLTLEDLAGMLDVVLFPDAYRLSQQALHSSAALLVTGVVESDPSRAEPLLRVEKVVPLEGPDGLPS
jgi:error-prone DNA polymerase